MSATVISLPGRHSRLPTRPTQEERDRALHAELRRARIRIAQLETALARAAQESLSHFERARAAERRIADLTGGR